MLEGTTDEVFASVTLNANEDNWSEDLMHERAIRFARLKMGTLTGMSWKEFIELPFSICEMWFKIGENERLAEARIANSAENEFNKPPPAAKHWF